ncbi:MAG: hypothetical protein R3E39_03945 [Anaerolineae bacterium]
MTIYGPRLLPPPLDNEEPNPYAPVWRNLAIISIVLLILVLSIFIIMSLIDLQLNNQVNSYIGISIALAPLALWILFSLQGERKAIEPRQSMLMTLMFSALIAKAISLPFIDNVLQVDKWLPLSSAVIRIIGFTTTVGIIQQLTIYGVLRLMAWPQRIRIRIDTIAYAFAASIGYITVVNLEFVVSNAPLPIDAVAFRIFANFAIQISTNIIVAYGLTEVRFSNPNLVYLPFTLTIATFMAGVALPIYTGLVNAPFSLAIATSRPLLGLGFSIVLLLTVSLIISILIRNADRRSQEARMGREE